MHSGRQPDPFGVLLKLSGSPAINTSTGAESFSYSATASLQICQICFFVAEDTIWVNPAFFADQAAALVNGLTFRKTNSSGVNTNLFDRVLTQTREGFALFHEFNAQAFEAPIFSTDTPSLLFYWDWRRAGQKITLQSGETFSCYNNGDNLNAMGITQIRCRLSGHFDTTYTQA